METELTFLKLGGSLITDKSTPRTPRRETLKRLAEEVAEALSMRQQVRLVIGHGSGSFGHMEAKRHGTADGIHSHKEWLGFLEVWHAADALNRMVVDALADAGLPVIRIAASGAALAESRALVSFPVENIQSAISAGCVPVVYGDVVFDRVQGGAIISTEAIFAFLARHCSPRRILMAGIERGVYSDFPARHSLLPKISTSDGSLFPTRLAGSEHPDVTGGMESKVANLVQLCREGFAEEALIFSGDEIGNVRRAVLGEEVMGTTIRK
jgi:isopentenyl phosphate kinase